MVKVRLRRNLGVLFKRELRDLQQHLCYNDVGLPVYVRTKHGLHRDFAPITIILPNLWCHPSTRNHATYVVFRVGLSKKLEKS